jgi:hypothetical protein
MNIEKIKELRDSGLTWNEVAAKLHPSLTGEQLRKKTKQTKSETKDSIKEEKKGKLVRTWQVQTKNGIEWLESRDATQEQLSVEDMKSIFSGIVISKIEPKSVDSELPILNIYLSDIHIGADTNVNLKNRFEQVKNFLYSNSKSFQYVNIIVLGDTIDGWNKTTTRGGHQLEQNMNNKEQFTMFQELFIRLMKVSEDIDRKMEFLFITNSNHGGDFEWICATAFQSYVNAHSSYANVTISDEVYTQYIMGEYLFIFTHGKDEQYMKRNLPLQLNDTLELKLLSYLPKNFNSFKEVIFVKGDLHQSCTNFGNYITYRNVTTFNGNTDWAKYNFGDNCRSGFEFDFLGAERSQGIVRFK